MRLGAVGSVAVACLVLIGTGPGARIRGETPAPKTAEELLGMVETTLRELPGVRFDVDAALVAKSQGVENKMTSSYSVCVESPRRWAIDMTSGSLGGATVSDGESLTTYLTINRTYSVLPLPEEWDAAKPQEPGASVELQIAALPKLLMGHGLKTWILAKVKSAAVRSEQFNGKTCWVGVFTQPSWSYELWTSQGPRPVVLRVVARSTPPAPADGQNQAVNQVSATITVTVKNWISAPKFKDADFVFTPPIGAEKAESLVAGMGIDSQAPHPLVGEPAPVFEAETLDGKHFKLADELKERVVMLDFWATSCAPCVEELPQVAATAAEMADKGVVFYAVNMEESPTRVREFLAEHKLNLPVLLDKDAAIARQYQVTGIPHTVLIGKDGRVQVVHIGAGGDVKSALGKELRALIDGKDLAEAIVKRRGGEGGGAAAAK